MDYKIAKYLFNQTTDEEAKETVERMDKNFTDEQIYRMYKIGIKKNIIAIHLYGMK